MFQAEGTKDLRLAHSYDYNGINLIPRISTYGYRAMESFMPLDSGIPGNFFLGLLDLNSGYSNVVCTALKRGTRLWMQSRK